ncbi:hypothetical protein JXA12_05965 [Candidatus Woesearchaeota archaeon]|nr:hypothetical protein [Candidatus Woesearchaeota archaeon]
MARRNVEQYAYVIMVGIVAVVGVAALVVMARGSSSLAVGLESPSGAAGFGRVSTEPLVDGYAYRGHPLPFSLVFSASLRNTVVIDADGDRIVVEPLGGTEDAIIVRVTTPHGTEIESFTRGWTQTLAGAELKAYHVSGAEEQVLARFALLAYDG